MENARNADLASPQEQTGKGASLRAARASSPRHRHLNEAVQLPGSRAAWKPGRLKRKCLLVGLEDGSPRACRVAKDQKGLVDQRSTRPFFWGNQDGGAGLLPRILGNRGFVLGGGGKAALKSGNLGIRPNSGGLRE
jgi:hypothetical protein